MSIDKLLNSVDDTTLDQVRRFVKVPPFVDDDLLRMLILSSRRKVITAVGSKFDDFFDNHPLFQAAVMLDVSTAYIERDKESSSAIFEHPLYQEEINSLKDEYRAREWRESHNDSNS